jgi:hypothetical protein
MTQLIRDTRFASRIEIKVGINWANAGFSDYTREHTLLTVPGAVYAVFAPHVFVSGQGGLENAAERAAAWFGRFAPAVIKPEDGGGERIESAGRLDPRASKLAVQNLVVTLECNAALAESFLRRVDTAALTSLLIP